MDKASGAGGCGRYGRGVAEVLIIEDDDRIRPLLVRGLRDCGHTVLITPPSRSLSDAPTVITFFESPGTLTGPPWPERSFPAPQIIVREWLRTFASTDSATWL